MQLQESLLRAKLAGRLEERERIARELHDTVMQSAHGMILQFQSVASRLPRQDPMRKSLEVALDHAGDLLGEARARVRELRTSRLFSDICRAIRREGRRLCLTSPIDFRFAVKGTPRLLHKETAGEICAIAREALSNAFRHSRAKTITAEVFFKRSCLVVRISDDGRGCGVDMDSQRQNGSHFGIQGMRERARLIGARMIFSSCDGVGTEIECATPATRAYAVARRVERWTTTCVDGFVSRKSGVSVTEDTARLG
jgi:signal transduction histidine kinase